MKTTRKGIRWSGLLLMVMLTVFGMVCGAMAADTPQSTNELDGSKIEGVFLEWVTLDSSQTAEGETVPASEKDDVAHLYLSTTNNDELVMIYRAEVQLSGQFDYDPGDVTIRIPAQIWPARVYDENGVGKPDFNVLQGELELPVPEAPSTKADFNWQLIGDEYVLTNTRKLGAASSVSIEVAVRGLYPINMVDMVTSKDITVHCEVVTNRGNTIEMTSESINAQVDTTTQLTYVHKDGEIIEDVSKVPQSLLANLPADDPEPSNYVYAKWHTYQSHKNNQPYSLEIKDVLSEAFELDRNGNRIRLTDGIFLGSENYPGTLSPEADVSFGAPVADNQEDTTSEIQYNKTVYMWSAYRKDKLPETDANEDQRAYYLENEVTWILTESDDEAQAWDTTDPQKVNELTDTVIISYSPMKWTVPPGSFIVQKWTEKRPNKDWDYGLALNQLELEQDVDMNFMVETVGYGWPWSSKLAVNDIPGTSEEELRASYGKLGWKQITEDYRTFFNYETVPLTVEDYEFKSLRVTKPTTYRYGKQDNGQYGYMQDASLQVPDLWVEYQLNNGSEWIPAAKVVYSAQGTPTIHVDPAGNAGADKSTTSITFPENVTNVRWYYISNQYTDADGQQVTLEHCDLGGVVWDMYPVITLKASDRVRGLVADLFKESNNPATKFKNDVRMDAFQWKNDTWDEIAEFADASRASLSGAGYGVSMTKSARYESDPENEQVLIHYTLTTKEQSNLLTLEDYNEAVAIGAVPAETSGVWYDLLPLHVVPKLDSVRVRAGDTAKNIYAIENYNDSGRYLLVVEVDLTPQPRQNDTDLPFYDSPTITFDAVYPVLDLEQYGNDLDNYAAFESTVDNLRKDENGVLTLGSIEGQRGEPDDPTAGNNNTTPSMPEDIVKAITNLDPATDENRFVYATTNHIVSALDYALSDLKKQVKNDLGGNWTQGLAEQEQVTVFEGHPYTYSLTVSSGAKSVSKDIILYDTIENYRIPSADSSDGTKKEDHQHVQDRKDWSGTWNGIGQWRGTLERVELGQLIDAGVAPVLYYSTIPDLQFAETKSEVTDGNYEEDTQILSSGYYDVTNTAYWTKAELVDGVWTVPDGVSVSAVAIDARKNAKGKEFILMPDEHLTAYLRMRAPDDDASPDVWNAKGAYTRKADDASQVDWEAALDPANNMYAFNNSRLRLMQGEYEDERINWTMTQPRMIRNDYTRVGIVPSSIKVEKEWLDDDDHDNLRPDAITVALMRKVAGTTDEPEPVLDANGQPIVLDLRKENGWAVRVFQVDVVNDEGVPYVYSFVEEPVEGYKTSVVQVRPGEYVIRNTHPNETVDLSGTKVWVDADDVAGLRPDSVQVTLYRDGQLQQTLTVQGNGDTWSYSFGQLPKYERGGREYVYRIEETYVPKYIDQVEGQTITNTLYPYGDLCVTKQVLGATSDAAAGKEFTFTLTLLQEKADPDAPDKPLEGKFAAQVEENVDGTWTKARELQLGNGDTFTLKGNQRLLITNLPSECRYIVEEQPTDGFTSSSKNADGFIRSGKEAEAAFTNTYSAKGAAQLEVDKRLTGTAIQKNKFKFELVDSNPGSETYGQVITVARVQQPEKAATGGLGESVESESNVLFGALRYTHEDHGNTFRYELREVDEELGGYTSDSKTYLVEVAVTDNGDGTLTVTPTYKDASGNALSELPRFENRYDATGEVQLKVWKTLDGREPGDKSFTFELVPCDEEGTPAEGATAMTATSNAAGVAVFEALSFDQDDVSLLPEEPAVYYYLASEQAGTDDTVIYSEQQYLFAITVKDNGDGTLSFSQSCHAITDGAVSADLAVPVFTNQLKPGALTVEKQVEGEGGNPDQEFTFKVKLTGENVGELDYTVTLPEGGTAPEEPGDGDSEGTDTPTIPGEPDTSAPGKVDTSKQVSATEEQLEGQAYAVLDLRADSATNGTLTFFRSSSDTPVDPYGFSFVAPTASKLEMVSSNGDFVYFFVNEKSTQNYPWHHSSYKQNIKHVNMAGYLKPISGQYFLAYMQNLETVSLDKLDTSDMTNMAYMIYSNDKITKLDLSTFVTKKATTMQRMVGGNDELREVDVSSFDTSNVTNMYGMFEGLKIERLDLSHFNTANVTDMAAMFNVSKSIKEINLYGFDTSKVTTMDSMFKNCWSLEKLNIGTFSINPSTNTDYMFFNDSKLKEITIGDDTVIASSYPSASSTGGYDGKWMKIDDPTQVHSSSDLFGTSFDKAGTWVWHEATYKLNFLPGEEGSGNMNTAYPPVAGAYTFAPTFTSATHELIGFKDEDNNLEYGLNDDGTCTIVNQDIDGNPIYQADEEVTLTAQWKKKQLPVTVTENGVTVKLKAGESITLNNLPAGTAYEVWEELPTGWVLVSKTNDAGEIQSTVTTTSTFTNKYDPARATVSLRASKLLDGEAPEADAFTFTLSDSTGTLQTKKNVAGGGVVFDTLTFDTAGTYTYTIKETADAQNTGIAYDSTECTVTVTVTADADGNLSASVSYAKGEEAVNADELVFNNTTKPGSLKLTKVIDGQLTDAARKKTFTFDITFMESALQPWSGTVTMTIDGTDKQLQVTDGVLSVELKGNESLTLTGIPAGVTYEVKETGDLTGWTISEEENVTGQIESNATAECSVTNSYSASGSVALQISKKLFGGKLQAGEFTFQLVGENNQVIGTGTNDAEGVVRFEPIKYTAEGKYSYAIVEVRGEDPVIEYSTELINVTVDVEDQKGDGQLTCNVTYPAGGAVITNRVKSGALAVTKKVVSINQDHLTNEQYQFSIVVSLTNPDPDGTPYQGVVYAQPNMSADCAIEVRDGTVPVTLHHDQTAILYGIPEGVRYEVTELDTQGFTASYEGETGTFEDGVMAETTITNTYHAKGEFVMEAVKKLVDADGNELPLEAGQFTFVITDEDNNLYTATNDADGKIVFDAIHFDETDVGEHRFGLYERNEGKPGYKYSEVKHSFVVTVKDNGDGTLSATTLFSGEDYTFENEFSNVTSIPVEKVWQDEENKMGVRPESVTMELYRNKVKQDAVVVLSEENGWKDSFEDLPALDEDGFEYTYEVREVPVAFYSGSSQLVDGVTVITNTLDTQGVLQITKEEVGIHTWLGTKKFEITVTLTNQGVPYQENVILEKNGSYELIMPDAEGKIILNLKHGEQARLLGLPYGLDYQTAEKAESGFTTQCNGEETAESADTVKPGVLHQANYVNSYKAEGSIELGATKVLNGRALEADQFSFELKDADGKVIEKVTNAADGSIAFAKLTYTEADLASSPISYTVTEVIGDAAGYTYDETKYTIEVTLKDEGDGTITATADRSAAKVLFTNSYKAEGSIELGATKELNGRALEDGQFSFELKDADGKVIEKVTNAADGSIAFAKLTYTETDLASSPITYTVTEVIGDAAGYTYDDTEYTIEVALKDEGDGTITATANLEAADVLFTNTYKAEGSIELGATKELNGRALEDGQFSFELKDADGKVIEKVTNAADGSIAFAKLTYTEADLASSPITYTVTEVIGDAAGYTYDDTKYTIEVTLKDEGDGTITATANLEAADVLFTNTYKAEGSIELGATKVLNGRALEADQFSFELKDASGNVIEEVTNAADGSIAFAKLTYTETDLASSPITYTVTEVIGDAAGYTYDDTEYTIEVALKDEGDGTITATANLEAADVLFTNTYEAEGGIELGATKVLNGRALEDGQFSFELKDADGKVIEKVTNAADGSIAFTKLTYTEADLGEHTYTVKEVKNALKGVTYDATEYTVKVTVTDNGDGTLKVVASDNAKALNFTNYYDADGELTLRATKTVNGTEPREDEVFTFELCDAAGKVLQTAKNQQGKITFEALKYTEADMGKSFLYTVKEQQEEKPGYTTDATVYTVAVWVADGGDGSLKVTKAISSEGRSAEAMTFDNTYEAEGQWKPTAAKTVNGAEPREDQVYEFTLTDKDGNTILAENEKGEITFDTLTYDLADAGKTYTYMVKEITTPTDLLATDESVYTVNVTVTDNKDGTLTVKPVITKDEEEVEEITFENILTTLLSIIKTVEGIETTETFPMTVKLYNANGTEAEGEYAYTGDAEGKLKSGDVIELAHGQSVTISGLLPGMKYTVTEAAAAAYETTVNGNAGNSIEGTLAETENNVAFVNRYKTTMFMVKKSWQGGGGGAIELTLYANGEKLEPQPIYSRDENVYVYTDLPMYDEQDQPIVYSAKERYVDGFLTIYKNVAPYADETKAIYDGGTIINKAIVKADFSVKKEWSGLAEGETAPEIELVLYCNGVATDIKTPNPDRNGWYKYYDLPGEVDGQPAVYTVKELPVEGYETSYKLANGISAEYADNGGTITNAKIPQTGDETPLAMWLTLMGASAMMLVLLLKRRKV